MRLTQILKSRTLWLSAALAGLGALEIQIQIIPEQYRGHALVAIAVLVAILRFITTQPISEK